MKPLYIHDILSELLKLTHLFSAIAIYHLNDLIDNVITNIIYYSMCYWSTYCPRDKIFSEKYEVKHLLYITNISEIFLNYFYNCLSKRLKWNESEDCIHIMYMYLKFLK